MQRRFALDQPARIEPVERPDAGVDGQLLLRRAVRHVVAVGDAVAVGDDQRRAGIGLGFEKRLRRLRHLGAERDPRDVDVAVHVRQQAEILLSDRLAGGGELRGRAERRRFRRLAAGVRVHLGVQHQDVDVAPVRQHVIEAAVADVVRPSVAADEPHALLHEVVGERFEPARLGRCQAGELTPQRLDPLALRRDAGLVRLIRIEQRRGQTVADLRRERWSRPRAVATCASSAIRKPKPNSALSSKSEFDHAGPRPSRFVVYGVVGRLPP